MLILLWPIMIVCAIAIKIEDPIGPVIFKQQRIGKENKPFTIFKFRTMRAEIQQHDSKQSDSERLLTIGKFLRKMSLDELPQLLNIIKGEMSFIGPRPLPVKYLPYYSEYEIHRHDIKPGISGWAQVNGRNNLKWEEKFEKDLEYVKEVSLIFDIKILFLTLFKIVKTSDVIVSSENFVIDFDEYRKRQLQSSEYLKGGENNIMIIQGERVILRAMEPEDMEMMRKMINDPEVEKYIGGWSFPISKARQLEWYHTIKNDNSSLRCTIDLKEYGAMGMIALTDIDWKNSNAEIHIKIGSSEHRGKGYGSDAIRALTKYALQEINLKCLYAHVLEYNNDSLKMFEKCGYKKEGILRKRIYKNGSFHDMIILSILSDEVEVPSI